MWPIVIPLRRSIPRTTKQSPSRRRNHSPPHLLLLPPPCQSPRFRTRSVFSGSSAFHPSCDTSSSMTGRNTSTKGPVKVQRKGSPVATAVVECERRTTLRTPETPDHFGTSPGPGFTLKTNNTKKMPTRRSTPQA